MADHNVIRNPQTLHIVRQLGRGAFGQVYLMRDSRDNREYAVKTEPLDAAIRQLPYEWRVYRRLQGCLGIPPVYAFWEDPELNRCCLAMEALGPSLEHRLKALSEWDVVNWIAPKALAIVESVHGRDFVHRDIKPENFMSGTDPNSQELSLVDMGLCKRYRSTGHGHIPYRDGKNLTGTVRYASLNTHAGVEQSRRDDLESLGYMLIYLVAKHLPWMNVKMEPLNESATIEARQLARTAHGRRVGEIKQAMTPEKLCESVSQASRSAFVRYFTYVRSLEFDATPDYSLLASYFTGFK